MLARVLLSFLLGAGYASCWWALVFQSPERVVELLPALGTMVLAVILIVVLTDHWNDGVNPPSKTGDRK
jgi:hypothetical protein